MALAVLVRQLYCANLAPSVAQSEHHMTPLAIESSNEAATRK